MQLYVTPPPPLKFIAVIILNNQALNLTWHKTFFLGLTLFNTFYQDGLAFLIQIRIK
jgi:hypothetical protein